MGGSGLRGVSPGSSFAAVGAGSSGSLDVEASVGETALGQLLSGLWDILGCLESSSGRGLPTAAWMLPVLLVDSRSRVMGALVVGGVALQALYRPLQAPPLVTQVVLPSSGSGSSGAPFPGDIGDVDVEKVRQLIRKGTVSDWCEVYVCFEGQLGAHLKPEVKVKPWKSDYVEIFFLASLGEILLGSSQV